MNRQRVPILLCILLAGPAAAENDGFVCNDFPSLPDCRALEAPLVSGTHYGRTLNGSVAAGPTAYFVGSTMYLQVHKALGGKAWPPGIEYCEENGKIRGETRLLFKKTNVTPTNVYNPATPVMRLTPCRWHINKPIDPVYGSEHGGGEGTGVAAPNGLYYQLSLTFYDTKPSIPSQQCDDWNQSCFPGIYIGANTSPESFPEYMWARLLSIYDHTDGIRRGWHFIRLAAFDTPGVPNPPTSVFPRQNLNGTPATLFGYVSWGQIPGNPGKLARVQIVDVPDGLVKPRRIKTRIYMVNAAGQWQLVNLDGIPGFVPENIRGQFQSYLEGTPQPFYDPTSGWRLVFGDANYAPAAADVDSCDESTRLTGAFPGDKGDSVVAHRSMTTSDVTIFDWESASKNGSNIGTFLLQIPGYSGLYALRGSTERICLSTQNWTHPWRGTEITVEQISPTLFLKTGAGENGEMSNSRNLSGEGHVESEPTPREPITKPADAR